MTAPELAPGAPPSTSEPALLIPPLVRHKVTPPPPDPQTLQRPRLLHALDEAVSQRLTLLAAPAGYGKTTLLASWLANVERRTQNVERPDSDSNDPALRSTFYALRFAWLSLAPEENDAALFATVLAAALQRAGLPLSWPPYPLCEGERQPRMILAWALNAVAALDEPVVLVLDSYDVVSSPATHELVSFMLEHAPPSLHLIIASRGEPPLPLARLRARRQLAELGADALRWNVAEAAMYLNDRLGLSLAPAQIADLVGRTEGWVTGLSLAALVIEERREAPLYLAAHRFVADYLMGEILEREPEATQSFLFQTALLDELSGPLVEALLVPEGDTPAAERHALLGGFPSGQAALEAIARRGLFLHSIDGRPGRYRYHRLFAETMRAQLRQRFPERAELLAWRAARMQGGRADEARAALAEQTGPAALAEPLSEREHETLTLIAAGKPNREIAALLSISESTVKSHLKHIFAKLSARNRTEAVAIARELQILSH